MNLNVLSLFAGIGGLELGLERAGMTTVGQVELDDYCRRVLAKHWPNVPRHDDVRTATDWWLSTERPTVDVICGGFPCQDISVAGRRAGIIDDERSSLWTFMAHTVRVLRPRYVLVENVPRVLVRGNDGVIPAEVIASDLATLGYDLRWDCIPAAALGARHRRDRWFGIAYAQRDALRVEPVTERWSVGAPFVAVDGAQQHVAHADGTAGRRETRDADGTSGGQAIRAGSTKPGRCSSAVADASSERRGQGWAGQPSGGHPDWSAVWPQALAHTEGQRRGPLGQKGAGQAGPDDLAGHAGELGASHTWATEPDVGRVAHGVPARVDRLRALGNAVVPQVAEHVGRLIVEHAASVAA